MSDPHYFDDDERTAASLAASRFVEALQQLGVEELDNLDLEAPCGRFCPTREARVSLGSYLPADLMEAARKLEAAAKRLSPPVEDEGAERRGEQGVAHLDGGSLAT
ncbi:hypothetical protein [Streptomyces melanogenes]|uniref:hypothetical protein n=1 Tax=Streptomyces melanogenes TaxID=67326 RepID=UPI00167C7A18|nr:hypothetical protein [Streptomyces melanogenes]GGP71902.1 hypothetical protein GCM10010278_57310 [Streptomyces melanogenes]